jgi:2-keto-4-pentenoate hydratase/2-oxohepta-3-ene-1,7-dioic acid hydratase in catechol pathway
MKLARFVHQGRVRQGFVEGEGVHLAAVAADRPLAALSLPDLAALRTAAREQVPLAEVDLLPPLHADAQVICVGINYRDHAAETGHAPAALPAVFLRHPRSLVGGGAPLRAPAASASFDYEGELAVVMARTGRRIAAEEALDYVAGYSCLMDGSVRDFQRSSVTAGKNFPASGAMGPWIVTRDEIPDPSALHLRTRLNGAVVQSASLGSMIHSVAALVAACSLWTELRPGDVIATGTPAGVGARRDPPRWLRAGDLLEVCIPGVGVLANPVVPEARS